MANMWTLIFTVYIAMNTANVVHSTYTTRDECLTAAHGKARIEVTKQYPNAAIAGYCVKFQP